ncbi:MAG: hypothetical protein K0V04_15800 [Deltaproteobacteria bacterium]|nr:hypothetical protein [Deltaproteobacteria bacterium]
MTEVYRFDGWHAIAQMFVGMDRQALPTVGQWLDARADRVHVQWRQGNPAVVPIVSSWHRGLVGKPSTAVLGHLPTRDDARQTVAREHGFEDWAAVVEAGDTAFDLVFETTVDAMLEGQLAVVQRSLAAVPALAHQRSSFGHAATLLHYIAANGVETERQVTPLNAAAMVTVLLDAGADPSRGMSVYGTQATTLELLLSSAHPRAAGVVDEVAALLRPSPRASQ